MSERAKRGDPWKAIHGHELGSLADLFRAEPDRLSRLSLDVAGVHFDWSKTHLDRGLLEAFELLAHERGLADARDELFSGGIVNASEGRPATHVAERGQGDPKHVSQAVSRHHGARSHTI